MVNAIQLHRSPSSPVSSPFSLSLLLFTTFSGHPSFHFPSYLTISLPYDAALDLLAMPVSIVHRHDAFFLLLYHLFSRTLATTRSPNPGFP